MHNSIKMTLGNRYIYLSGNEQLRNKNRRDAMVISYNTGCGRTRNHIPWKKLKAGYIFCEFEVWIWMWKVRIGIILFVKSLFVSLWNRFVLFVTAILGKKKRICVYDNSLWNLSAVLICALPFVACRVDDLEDHVEKLYLGTPKVVKSKGSIPASV